MCISNQFIKKKSPSNLTFVMQAFLQNNDNDSIDILNQFMKEKSLLDVITVLQLFSNKDICTDILKEDPISPSGFFSQFSFSICRTSSPPAYFLSF
jgi:hypothetical protein